MEEAPSDVRTEPTSSATSTSEVAPPPQLAPPPPPPPPPLPVVGVRVAVAEAVRDTDVGTPLPPMPEHEPEPVDAPPEDDIDARFVSSMFAAARRGEAPAVLAAADAFPSLLHAKDDANGWTLLHLFSRLSLAAPVGALLKRGADPEARDRSFRSALHMAALADAQPEVALADGAAGASAAPIAEADRPKAIIATLRTLLKAGARTTARDSFGFTALHHAAHAGHTEAVLFLLSLNTEMRLPRAPLEAETNAEERPLHLAAAGGHATTVRLLLEHGAHTGKTNYLGQTPLHLACRGGDEPRALDTAREIVKPEWKADLSSADSTGATPLHVAAAGGHGKMVGVLLHARGVRRTGGGRGVLLDELDKRGRAPSAVAREEGFDDVAATLEAASSAAAEREKAAEADKERALRQAFAATRLDDNPTRRAKDGRATGVHASGALGGRSMTLIGEEDPDAMEAMMEACGGGGEEGMDDDTERDEPE